jgi:predicted XRE-type DNA-binding protein
MSLVRPIRNGLSEVRSNLQNGRIARVLFRVNEEDPEAGAQLGVEACERNGVMKKNIGSSFDSWLHEEGTYEDVASAAIKRVLARQLEAAMQEKQISRTEMARQMHTSRAALNRLLDPGNDSVTLATLRKAALVVGRQIRLELI